MRSPAEHRPRATSTSRFGVSRRENHDASAFYERFTPPAVSADAEVAPRKDVDDIFCGDARDMAKVDDGSVGLVVTSPPYFAGKEYETALGVGGVPATYAHYLQMLEEVFAECVRKLEPGGRVAVNVANLGRRPYRSLSGDVTWILQDRLRLLLRGEVVWVKARGSTGSCAWGSFQQPGNPVLRDLTERVVIASKGRFDRAIRPAIRATRGLPSEASISKDEFMDATTDVWELSPESASRVGHPAPFPVELPERLIHLHTYVGDLVLDPFMGSGTTAVAAVRTRRHFVGYDTDQGYVSAALERVAAARAVVPGERSAARTVARGAVEVAGFTGIAPSRAATFAARDEVGRTWRFEVCGGFTAARRTDLVWRAIGRAAAHHARAPEEPFVLLMPFTPVAGGDAAAALRAVSGPGRPVHAVVVLDGDAAANLRRICLAG